MSTSERVRAIISDSLYADLDKVTPTAKVMQDLGAESIDFLDILFRLESEFDIRMPRGEVEKRARGHLSEAEFAVEGRLTPAGLANLQSVMPEVPADSFQAGMHVREIPALFTVATFVGMVERELVSKGISVATPAA